MTSPSLRLPYWDSHCHLTHPLRASGSRQSQKTDSLKGLDQIRIWIEACKVKGLERFCLGGYEPEEWKLQLELQAEFGDVIVPCFGLHPWWVHDCASQGRIETLRTGLQELAKQLGGARGCGELGLDYANERKKSAELQKEFFEAQLKTALEIKKPLVLHVVRAHADAISILKKNRPSAHDYSGLVHSFSGDVRDAKKYLELGFLISIHPRILDTRPENTKRLVEVVKSLPMDSMVFETDAPDQASSPLVTFEVAAAVARIRKSNDVETLMRGSAQNMERVFG